MKNAGNSALTIILFIVLIPVLADLIISLMLPEDKAAMFSLVRLVSFGFIESIPVVVDYLILAFILLYFILLRKKRQIKKDE